MAFSAVCLPTCRLACPPLTLMSALPAMILTFLSRRFGVVSLLALAGLAGTLSWSPAGGADTDNLLAADFDSTVKPFLQQHCVRCHNEEKLSSGIRVDLLDAALEDRHLKLWEGIRSQVEKRAMPPEDEPQPTDEARQKVLEWIERGLHVARTRPTPKNGGSRRLTVAQYRNTLRELLLLDDDLADVLPPDAVSKDGFVNNQETLALSPLLVEAYFDIADKALSRCIVDPSAKPKIQNFRVDLGAGLNREPIPDKLILGADSLLLNNADFVVTQLTPTKPFEFEPVLMQTKLRYIEGYQGNDTVRGWRDFDSIYHSVFACLRGTGGYPKGRPWSTIPQGLLLRPAIPSAEVFGVESTYGPRANFKISLRELPEDGRFRVTVTAAKFDDGLLLDPGTASQQPGPSPAAVVCEQPGRENQTVSIAQAGVYQVDVFAEPPAPSETKSPSAEKPPELTLALGARQFVGTLHQPAFLAVRLPAGPLMVHAQTAGIAPLQRVVLTRLPEDNDLARRFAAFETRSPRLGVHLGLRRDCGSTLTPVGEPQTVAGTEFSQFVFEGAIRNFPSPDVEADNVNYLAGIREIGVRSEFTDGRDMPQLLIRAVEFEGPFYETWPPATHRSIFVESPQQNEPKDYAREVLIQFASRAFRRPVTDEELAPLLAVFQAAFESGATFEHSIQDALQVVLTSPQFLLLIEHSTTPEPEALDEYELAAKLSYFLWNGPPDAITLQLAAEGRLRQDLHAEVDRLVSHPRFSRFVAEFTGQWLALDKFAVLEPDRERFPKLTRDTRAQLRREPAEYVHYLIRQNLPVRNLVESDFVLANEVVATYYDLPERPESGFEFIPIRHQRPELGGVLSQAAILAGLSDGRESNPVKRGSWLARRIVAEPPDDPPPNVPALPEDGHDLTLRERLERHRNQPGCAQCHAKIDPWGIPFEEFDAGGRRKAAAVDGRSSLPDGYEVAGFAELRHYLAEDRVDQVAFSVLKHLTVYATGRSLTYNELGSLKLQGLQLKQTGYRMRDLIQFVVHSPMFLEK